MSKKILFFVSEDWFFRSHFFERALGAKAAGFDVTVLARESYHSSEIKAAGMDFISLNIDRAGLNPSREIQTLARIFGIYKNMQPDVVHQVAMKPILYGTIAAMLTGVPAIVNAPVGLGYIFTSETLRARILRLFVTRALRLLLNPRRSKVVFENEDDLNSFVASGVVRLEDAVLIPGAGVDLAKFRAVPEPDSGPIVVLLYARMLWDKGIREFVEAAALLNDRGQSARFILAGSPDDSNPASIPVSRLAEWSREGIVEWMGHRTDIPELLASSHIVCLPSYREGLPKSLIEALAASRPVVTTDVPGCRHVVRHEYNGLLVKVRDAKTLAEALLRLIKNPDERKHFGANGRLMAEQIFASELIVESTVELYKSFWK